MDDSMPQENWIESLHLPDSSFKKGILDMLFTDKQERRQLRCPEKMLPSPSMSSPHPPFGLEDIHLSSELSLRQVIYAPSLLQDMENEFRHQFELYLAEHGVPKRGSRQDVWILSHQRDMFAEPRGIYCFYAGGIGRECLKYASRLYVAPNVDQWIAPFDFCYQRRTKPFLLEASVFVRSVESSIPQEINPDIRNRLEAMYNNDVQIATLSCYPPSSEGESIIDRLADGGFQWTTPGTHGGGSDAHRNDRKTGYTCEDSASTFWDKYISSSPQRPPIPHHDDAPEPKNDIWIPGAPEIRSTVQAPNPHHFIQRVRLLSYPLGTLANRHSRRGLLPSKRIVPFCSSCGTKERIGIRHRSTNTLILSDVIDPYDDATYGLIQMAFWSAAVKDALNRNPKPGVLFERVKPESQKPLSHKDEPKNVSSKAFDEEMARRPVILLSYDDGIYSSPAPSAFLRNTPSCTLPYSDKFQQQEAGKTCPITDCILLEITELVGSGTFGASYRGIARLPTDTGPPFERTIVVKVDISPKTCDAEGIGTEYEAYHKLAINNVSEGILKMYGLFKDPESGIVLLAMQDGGTTFVDGRIKTLSDSEFKILSKTVQDINAAGILHNDIKWNNLLRDDEGNPYIIDFGIAQFTSDFDLYSEVEWPWGEEDARLNPPPPHALRLMEEERAKAKIRSPDLQAIEDIYLGRHDPTFRYPTHF